MPIKNHKKKHNKIEVCQCGKKYKLRFKMIQEEKTPLSRNQLICHCDSCGKEWGTHECSPTDKENIKDYCVICDKFIEGQTIERYENIGNYCNKCNQRCEKHKLTKEEKAELKKIKKLLNSCKTKKEKKSPKKKSQKKKLSKPGTQQEIVTL